MWKMSLGDVHIMMFYGRPKNFNLMGSIKFITTTFLKNSFSIPSARKNNWSMSYKSSETSQGRHNYVLKWRLQSDVLGTSQDVNFEHKY